MMGLYSASRNGGLGKGEPAAPRSGRHARPASPPASALSDILRDRGLERIGAADRAVAEAHARLRVAGADSDVINGAFALVREALSEARDTVREARRERALVLHEWEQLTRRLQNSSRYPEAAAPVVPDPPGVNLCPDPASAQTPAEFVDTLRRYRKWAGEPSYRAMEHFIRKQCSQHFAASTLHAALKSDGLPSLQKVQAIITACGGNDEHRQMFTVAWRQLAMPRQGEARQGEARPPQSPALYSVSEPA